jgi:predicted hydrocarbon binding protein
MMMKLHISHIFRFCLMVLFFAGGTTLIAQDAAETDKTQTRSKRFRTFEYKGETYLYGQLDDIDITANYPNRWQRNRGKRKLARYTRMQWNIHKVYPYALKVSEVLQEVEAEMAQIADEDARKDYLKEKETALFGAYEDDVRKMSRSQGKVLVKLVHRQTGISAYELIKETKSGASAVFWQSIGRIFGINLKSNYDSEDEKMIEDIVRDLENGGYNIYYRKYNYRLT